MAASKRFLVADLTIAADHIAVLFDILLSLREALSKQQHDLAGDADAALTAALEAQESLARAGRAAAAASRAAAATGKILANPAKVPNNQRGAV